MKLFRDLPTHPLPPSPIRRTLSLLAVGALLGVAPLSACEGDADPALEQDTTSTPDLSGAEDTAPPDDTTPTDGTVPPEDTTPSDTATPEDAEPPPDTATPDDATAPTDTVPPEDGAGADTTPPADTTTPDDTSGPPVLPTTRPPTVTSHETTLSAFSLEPGRETTRCVVKRLDNASTLWVSDVVTQLAPGSHHLIVYKSDETEERPEPFTCDPFVETLRGQTFPIMITQIRNETLSFPNGVAFRFEPNQMIRLEAHYLNYFPNPISAEATVTFRGIAESDVVSEANMLFYGNPDFTVPPMSSFTTPWRYLSVLPGTQVFALTGHTHAFGTDVEVEFASSVETPGMSVYPPADEPFDWEEPPVARYEPPLSFGEAEGFRYRCGWNNTTNERLEFGESANREMCFFWAYYYPSQGYRICISPGSIGDGLAGDEVCCPGHWVCDMVDQFL